MPGATGKLALSFPFHQIPGLHPISASRIVIDKTDFLSQAPWAQPKGNGEENWR